MICLCRKTETSESTSDQNATQPIKTGAISGNEPQKHDVQDDSGEYLEMTGGNCYEHLPDSKAAEAEHVNVKPLYTDLQ